MIFWARFIRLVFVTITIASTFACFNVSVADTSPSIIPYIPVRDTARWVELTRQSRLRQTTGRWVLEKVTAAYSLRDTVHVRVLYKLPLDYSDRRIQYQQEVEWCFFQDSVVNGDRLSTWLPTLPKLIKRVEDDIGVFLFLRQTDARRATINFWNQFTYFGERDTLAYQPDIDRYSDFTFRDSTLIRKFALYTGIGSHPAMGEFARFVGIRYLKQNQQTITVASGDFEKEVCNYFIFSVGNSPSRFRLSNSFDWSAFPEISQVSGQVYRFLFDSEGLGCSIAISKGIGVTKREPYASSDGYCARFIVGVFCERDAKNKAVEIHQRADGSWAEAKFAEIGALR